MPVPGRPGNNEFGINSFSGPLGQKEPAYGATERMKVLSKIGVQPNAALTAPDRSRQAAKRGTTMKGKAAGSQPQEAPPQTPIQPELNQPMNYQAELVAFWQELAATPGASPLVQKIAAEVTSGGAVAAA